MNNQTQEALKMAHKTFMQMNERSPRKDDGSGLFDKEIIACKEALEQQEIGPAEIKQMLNDIEYHQKRVEELEQQAQEPVAWMDVDGAVSYRQDFLHTIPLYTHPAQPLSDEQIIFLWNKHGVPMTGPDFLKLVRDIEAVQAHGIGVKDE